VEHVDFDQVVITGSDGHRVTMSKDDYFRQALRVRVDQLVKGRARFFQGDQAVSALKALKHTR
jgi:hypothetical protein